MNKFPRSLHKFFSRSLLGHTLGIFLDSKNDLEACIAKQKDLINWNHNNFFVSYAFRNSSIEINEILMISVDGY